MYKKSALPMSLLLILLAGDRAAAQTCGCKNPRPYSVAANQASGIVQSWEITDRSPGVAGSQFEQPQSNKHFGYSFMNIPYLCNPVLTVVARPLNNFASDSGNDSLNLQVQGSTYRWSRMFRALVPANAWITSAVPGWQTITLPLSSLPGSVDLSMDLVTTRLDVYIQDDTAVRSLTLSGQRCPGPGISRTSCCGDGAVGWADSSNMFALHSDGNIKRAFYHAGGAAQWIQMAGSSPIVRGSFAPFDATAVLVVNDLGQVIKVSPSGAAVIPNSPLVHPCSLVVTKRGIFGVRKSDGHIVLIKNNGQMDSAAPWGAPHRPVETSLIEIYDGRVAGVTQHGFPWNVWFDGNGKMQWATITEIGTVQVP